jgi:hypothetical protein
MKITIQNKAFFYLMIVLAGSLGACRKSFVDLTSPTAISTTVFYKTQADINSALTGVYGELRSYYDLYWSLTELPSDNTVIDAPSLAAFGQYKTLTWNASDGQVLSKWAASSPTGAYTLIADANNVITYAPNVTMDPALQARYIGEAKFLRALMYFNLARMFGDVPLVTAPITSEADGYALETRTALTAAPTAATIISNGARIYAQIEKDLQDAVAALPATYTAATDQGRATSGSATALLGKVYVYEQKWSQAATILSPVAAAGNPYGYQLLPNYADVFSPTNRNNKEMVFSIQYLSTGNSEGSSFTIYFLPQESGSSLIAPAPSSYDLGSADLYNAFESGDLRKTTCIRTYTSGTATWYYTAKFLETGIKSAYEGNCSWPVMRYADVLLLYAEALNESGNTAGALTVLQQVRTRAGLATDLTLDQPGTRAAIRKERRVELCFEGHRWWDLIRTDQMMPVMTAFAASNGSGIAGSPIQIGAQYAFKALYPIPQSEINLIKGKGLNTLPQNFGY